MWSVLQELRREGSGKRTGSAEAWGLAGTCPGTEELQEAEERGRLRAGLGRSRQGLANPHKQFGFYIKCNGNPLEHFRLSRNVF